MTRQSTAHLVSSLGDVFAVFDQQDSLNVSYGVQAVDGRRFFVKTAGSPEVSPGGLTRGQRVELLRVDAALHKDVAHPALIAMHDAVETSDGIAIMYDWFDGSLLNAPSERRENPEEAYQRFASLPSSEIVAALDCVIELHVVLESAGWVAGDFYDGCLMYDFGDGGRARDDGQRIKVMDFECYRRGAYVNDKGRLPGSTRFMAPEEFTRGATIDARTTVFNLARMVQEFLLRRNDLPDVRAVVEYATADEPPRRFPSVAALYGAWQAATQASRTR